MAKDQANGGYRREGGYRNERKDNWKGRDFRGDSGDTRDRRNFRNDQDRRDRGERGEGNYERNDRGFGRQDLSLIHI